MDDTQTTIPLEFYQEFLSRLFINSGALSKDIPWETEMILQLSLSKDPPWRTAFIYHLSVVMFCNPGSHLTTVRLLLRGGLFYRPRARQLLENVPADTYSSTRLFWERFLKLDSSVRQELTAPLVRSVTEFLSTMTDLWRKERS